MRRSVLGVLVAVLVVVFPAAADAAVHTQLVGNFDTPIQVFAPRSVPGSTLYVVEKGGKIIRRQSGGHRNVVLDIHGHVSSGGEQGLLSAVIADRKLFVYYTNRDGDSRVVRYTLNSGLGHVQSGSRNTILRANQPDDEPQRRHAAVPRRPSLPQPRRRRRRLRYVPQRAEAGLEARQAPPSRLERLEDRRLRPAQPLALVVRPRDRRRLHRRRRPVQPRGGRLSAALEGRSACRELRLEPLRGRPPGNLLEPDAWNNSGPADLPEVRLRPRRRLDGHRRLRLPRVGHAGAAGRYFFGDIGAGGWIKTADAKTLRNRQTLGFTVSGLYSFGENSKGELYAVSGSGPVYKLVDN